MATNTGGEWFVAHFGWKLDIKIECFSEFFWCRAGTVLAKIGHINQILKIQMYPVSQTQRELVFKNTTPLPGGFAK